MYTIKVRLSPSWNRLGQYLCQEDDFLIASKEINAIKFDVIVTSNNIFLICLLSSFLFRIFNEYIFIF